MTARIIDLFSRGVPTSHRSIAAAFIVIVFILFIHHRAVRFPIRISTDKFLAPVFTSIVMSCHEYVPHLVPWSSSVIVNITAILIVNVTIIIILILIVIIISIIYPMPERAHVIAFCFSS